MKLIFFNDCSDWDSFSSFITHYIENLHIDGLFYSGRDGLEVTKYPFLLC